MKDRIKQIRKAENLKQSEFAEKLNLASNYISLVETGKNEVSDKLIHNIVSVFGINEEWLRTGSGEMRSPLTREAEIAEITMSLLRDNEDKRLELQKLFVEMSEENIELLYQTAKKWVENVEKKTS